MKILFVLSLLIILGSGTVAFAETTYEIDIPYGASDSGSPYFWFEQSTEITTGEITVNPGDSVMWNNVDTAFHTVTSITSSGELDGIFDSGFFTVGESYNQKFNDLGDFDYFCSLHPWMIGTVHVIDSIDTVQSIEKIPSWVKNIFVWYGEGIVSEDELLNAIKYLINEKILVVN